MEEIYEKVQLIKNKFGKLVMKKDNFEDIRSEKSKSKMKGKKNVKWKQKWKNNDNLEENLETNKYWKKKSIFFELEYQKYLLLRHNLDVMHIEKNVCNNITRTVLNIPGKSKDGLATRLDLIEMLRLQKT